MLILKLSPAITEDDFIKFCRSHKGYLVSRGCSRFVIKKSQHITESSTHWMPSKDCPTYYVSFTPAIKRNPHDENKPILHTILNKAFPEDADEISSWKY